MSVYVFPGQGAQSKGMAQDLLIKYKDKVNLASEVMNIDMNELILEDPNNHLSLTQYTQPAMFLVNVLYFYHSKDLGQFNAQYLAGHSLGEFNALHAAEVFSFNDGLKLVKKRGELIANCGNGKMAAIIGLTKEKIEDIFKEHQLLSIDLANYNTPSQIVISGPDQDILKIVDIIQSIKGARAILLNVSGAFHSRYMKSARDQFSTYLEQFSFNKAKIPVIANLTAKPYQDDYKNTLADQINHCVLWSDSIIYLLGQKMNEFIELGPGNILQGLIKKIKQSQTE